MKLKKMMKKRMSKKILGVIVVFIMIASGFSVVLFNYILKETPIEKEPEQVQIDNRISPLTQQAIYVVTQRIRRKNKIIDQIMNDFPSVRFLDRLPIKDIYRKKGVESLFAGYGWDETPIFNFEVVFGEEKYTGPIYYKAWDTEYINNNQYKLIQEWNENGSAYTPEKEKTEIQINILEKVKNRFKTTTNIAETINLEYDFRTGRWTGDDYFNDSDGYGHFNGTKYEVWFQLYQTDYDHDGIPYWTEVNVLGTDPKIDDSTLDPDGDGIPTDWEWRWGYDPFTWDDHANLDPDNDGLQNNEEYLMKDWLANPYTPEMYVEVDHMAKAPYKPLKIELQPTKLFPSISRPKIMKTRMNGWEHCFYEESQQMIMDRFNEHGITVHVDDGCMGEGGDEIPYARPSFETDGKIYDEGIFDAYKGLVSQYYNTYFPQKRVGIFRYMLVLPGGGECFNMDYKGMYDTVTVPMNKGFYKNMLSVLRYSERMKRIGVAISTLHELGHTCGMLLFHHGGVDNTTKDVISEWDDYESVMNYMKYSERLFDYSDGSHGERDINDWKYIDVGFFQRTSEELEGCGFNKHLPPFYR